MYSQESASAHTSVHIDTEKVVQSGEAVDLVSVFTTQTWIPDFDPQDPMLKIKDRYDGISFKS